MRAAVPALLVLLTLAISGAASACPVDRTHCFELVTHVVEVDGTPVVTEAWIDAQLAHANRLFASIDTGFWVRRADPLSASWANVETRTQRDRLAARDTPGVVHLFIAKRLANVDEPGQINGVHWRNRKKRSQRVVLLSSIAWELTLAHELGHFFGLPHSQYVVSIMNKTPRSVPAPKDRVFHERELARMKGRKRQMLRSGVLTSRKPDLP